jgi:hypothetical protein
MISKTIGFRGTQHFQTRPFQAGFFIGFSWLRRLNNPLENVVNHPFGLMVISPT